MAGVDEVIGVMTPGVVAEKQGGTFRYSQQFTRVVTTTLVNHYCCVNYADVYMAKGV